MTHKKLLQFGETNNSFKIVVNIMLNLSVRENFLLILN